MYWFRKIKMTEDDWEEFKKRVTPLNKKKIILKKSKQEIILKKTEQIKKIDTDFYYNINKEKSPLEKNTLIKINSFDPWVFY